MKTLYDRLKPELREALELEGKKYPETVEDIKNSLKNKYYWVELKVGEAMNLCNLLEVVFSVDSLYDIFNY